MERLWQGSREVEPKDEESQLGAQLKLLTGEDENTGVRVYGAYWGVRNHRWEEEKGTYKRGRTQ